MTHRLNPSSTVERSHRRFAVTHVTMTALPTSAGHATSQHSARTRLPTRRWRMISALVVATIAAMSLQLETCQAQFSSLSTSKAQGSSSRQNRTDAVAQIPFNELNKVAQQRLKSVVSNPSFYRRLPVSTIDADPDYFRFLVRKPEVVVSIWRLMGVTEMTTNRVGPYSVETDDGAGTISNLELVYGNNDLHIFYGTGSYEGPVLRRKLTGRCVIVVRSQSKPKQDGGFDHTSQLDVFLKVDNSTAALITRTIQPVVGSTADHNFVESLKFIERLNQTTRNNGPGVKAMARRLELTEETQQSYEKVIDKVFERAYQSSITSTQPRKALTDQNELALYRPSSRQYNYFGGSAPAKRDANTSQANRLTRGATAPTNIATRQLQNRSNNRQQSSIRSPRTSPQPQLQNRVQRSAQNQPTNGSVAPAVDLPHMVRDNEQSRVVAQPVPQMNFSSRDISRSQTTSRNTPVTTRNNGTVAPNGGYSILVGGPLPSTLKNREPMFRQQATTIKFSDAAASEARRSPSDSSLPTHRR